MAYVLKSLVPLRSLEAAVRHGNIDTAALALGVTDKSIMDHLNRLNADLGVQLCTIKKRNVVASPFAQTLADAYCRAMHIFDDALTQAPVSTVSAPIVCIAPTLFQSFLGTEIRRLISVHGLQLDLVSHVDPSTVEWEAAVGLEPAKKPFTRNHVLARLTLTLVSPDRARLVSPFSLKQAGRVVAADGTPWRRWLDDQGLSDIAANVEVVADSARVEAELANDDVAAIVVRSFFHDRLAAGDMAEAEWTRRSAQRVDLYYSRTLRKSFGDDLKELRFRLKAAAIKADAT